MSEHEDTQAIQGLTQTLKELRRQRRFGLLEVLIIIVALIMLIAGFLSISYVIREQVRQAARDRAAESQRALIQQTAIDARNGLLELRAALMAGPAAQDAAIRRILAAIDRMLDAQTRVIVREQNKQETIVVVVTAPPSPQPTVTVTCDPRPLTGSCRRVGGT